MFGALDVGGGVLCSPRPRKHRQDLDSGATRDPAVSCSPHTLQRDEETHQPVLFYAKLPARIAERYVLLLDPMLATGGTALKAIEVLVDKGVKLENIIFVCLIAAPEGLQRLTERFPTVRIGECSAQGASPHASVLTRSSDVGRGRQALAHRVDSARDRRLWGSVSWDGQEGGAVLFTWRQLLWQH